MSVDRKLRVFLCHASQDKPVVRELYGRLLAEGWIDPWLDTKRLLPGQDWRLAIEEAVETADNVIICLSKNSVSKEGYIQKEMRYAQEISLEKPEGLIFLIPVRLEECQAPRGLRFFQWTNYFDAEKEQSYQDLLKSLRIRFEEKFSTDAEEATRLDTLEESNLEAEESILDIQIPLIGKMPVKHRASVDLQVGTRETVFAPSTTANKSETEDPAFTIREETKKLVRSYDFNSFMNCPICRARLKEKNVVKHIDENHGFWSRSSFAIIDFIDSRQSPEEKLTIPFLKREFMKALARSMRPNSSVECPICQVQIKKDNLVRHYNKNH